MSGKAWNALPDIPQKRRVGWGHAPANRLRQQSLMRGWFRSAVSFANKVLERGNRSGGNTIEEQPENYHQEDLNQSKGEQGPETDALNCIPGQPG